MIATTMRSRLPRRTSRPPAWSIWLLAAAGIALVPWSIALSAELPADHVARHWDIAWAGFDAWLAIILLATVTAAIRRSSWLPGWSLAAAAVLVCDAWFDVVTSSGGLDLWLALLTAVAVELPLAIVCALICRQALPRAAVRKPAAAPDRG